MSSLGGPTFKKSILNVRREGREVNVVKWGSEYWNSLVFEWSIKDSPLIKWSVIQMVI